MISISRQKKYLRIGISRIVQDLRTRFFLKTGTLMPLPERLYYFMTSKCNFRCRMCPEWKAGLSEIEEELLNEERMRGIIDEMRELGFKELGFSGGEPLLYREKLLRLAEYAAGKKIYTHVATNGSLIDEKFLSQYDRIGGGHISLSLDALGELHDELRGFAGAFSGVEKVIGLLKPGKYPNILLKINFTITNENLSEAPKVVRLAAKSGAVIFFQPYDPYDYGHRSDCGYLVNHYPLWIKKENRRELRSILDELKALKKDNPGLILNSVEHLEAIYSYFKGEKKAKACYAGLDQISVFSNGDVIFCKFGRVGNLKRQGLKEYIYSAERGRALKASLNCTENCLLGCQYRPGLMELAKNGFSQLKQLSKIK